MSTNDTTTSSTNPLSPFSPDDMSSMQSPASSGSSIDPSTGLAVPPTQQPSLALGTDSPYKPLQLAAVDPGPGVQLQPEEQQGPLGAVSHAGAAAYMADHILRGAIQGRQQAALAKAQQFNKTLAAQQGLYNDSAQNYKSLIAAGSDPNSPEVQDAQAKTKAAWDSMMQSIGQQIPQPKLGKDGKPKPNQPSVVQRILGAQQDPTAALGAWYEGAQKLGPPVFHDVAPMLTPAYQAKVKQGAQTQGVAAQTGLEQAQNQQELQTLLAKPNPTDDEQNRIYQLRYGMSKSGSALPPGVALKPLTGAKPVLMADGSYQMPMVNTFGQTVMKPLPQGFLPPPALMKGLQKIDTTPDGVWYSYDVDQRGNELPNTRKPLSSAAMAPGTNTSGTTVQTHVNPDGTTYQTTNSTSSTKTPIGGGASAINHIGQAPLHTAGGGEGAASTLTDTLAATTTAPPTQPTATTAPASAHPHTNNPAPAGGSGGTLPQSSASSQQPPPSTTPGLVAGAIMPKDPPAIKKVQDKRDEDYQVAQLGREILADPTPNPSAQVSFMNKLIHSSAGRVNEKEIDMQMHAAGFEGNIDNWTEKIKTGGMAPQLFAQMVDYAGKNLQASNATLADVRQRLGAYRNPPPPQVTPASHVFSQSAWLRANRKGDVAAAKAAALAQKFTVVP